MEASAGEALGTYGPWGLLGLVVLAIVRGHLVPRSVVEDVRAELAYSRASNRELIEQRNAAWAETAKLAVQLTEALPRKAPRGPARGSASEVVT